MRPDIKNALINFENRHHAAVQCDTELGLSGDDVYFRLERTAKRFWADYYEARKELEALLETL
jgi:hypothetical protein